VLEHYADVVAAVGGSSVIGTAKAMAMLLGKGGDPLDYLEVVSSGRPIIQLAAPCVAMASIGRESRSGAARQPGSNCARTGITARPAKRGFG
jgi:alcohol dehydrogenase YqhD (iron-dependent ADH family)